MQFCGANPAGMAKNKVILTGAGIPVYIGRKRPVKSKGNEKDWKFIRTNLQHRELAAG
jgi:hypothetical protein